MGADESGTIARQKIHRSELIDPEITEHNGRIVKTTGDGLLVEFRSAVDATECATKIQLAIRERETGNSEEHRMQYRVGINLGDIVIDGDDILGDGVNVAARLEGIADPGGIHISRSVYDQVRDKLEISVEDLGEVEVKNIARPVQVFRVSLDEGTESKSGTVSEATGRRPSIAVLAFENMSGDPDQEYFADGIAEDILTALSKFRQFVVIARNSSFTYKGRAVDVKQVARELDVQYVLEGSVRKAGNRVRITGQLIDARSGGHVWAERYDRDLEDIFAVQDEITTSIVGAIAPGVVSAEIERTKNKQATELDTWERIMRAHWHIRRFTQEGLAEGVLLLDELLGHEPDNVVALGDLAFALHFQAAFGWSEPPAAMERMGDAARRAVVLDDQDSAAHTAVAIHELFSGRHDDAIRRLRRAIELNPNSNFARGYLGTTYAFGGECDPAIENLQAAIRLGPRDLLVVVWHTASAWAYMSAEKFEEAVESAREAIDWNPEFADGYSVLSAALAHLDRRDDARVALGDLVRRIPGLTLGDSRLERPLRRDADRQRFLTGLRAAGLPEA